MNTSKTHFTDLGVSPDLMKALDDMGFEEATPIQQASIPLLLAGRDIIGYSQTGTGKTGAFGIPAIEKIDTRSRSRLPQVLVLCPTRELALQVCDEMTRFARFKRGVRIVPIYGGQAIERQFRMLEQGAHIVIGTPGRIMDHMRRGTLKLHVLKLVILDEADEMLNMGFREDVETILDAVPEERQTALFSATMPPAIIAITDQYQRDPQLIKIVHQQLTVPNTEQFYYEVPPGRKNDALCHLLESYNPKRSIIFCNTKRQVDELVTELQVRGYMVSGLHGDMRQATRTQVMNTFKSGTVDILVATDVAARGIDVDDVEAVFNYDVPVDVEYYVHRIGRTGRAGKNGRAFTLVTGRKQIYELRQIQNFTKAKIQRQEIPSTTEIEEHRVQRFFDEVRNEINTPTITEYANMVDTLMREGYTSIEVAAALMKMALTSRQNARKPQAYQFSRDKLERSPFEGRVPRESRQQRVNPRGPEQTDEGGHSRERRSDMVRLMVNVGRYHKVSANHIVGAITGETGLSGKTIGKILVSEKSSYVDVPRQHVEHVLQSMQDCKIRGLKTSIQEVEG